MPTVPHARRRVAAALVCAVAVTALAARPADAQLRKLKDLGKAAVKGAVEGKTEDAGGGAPARAGRVAFSENLLEITDARLAQFLRGFDAEVAARPEAERQYQRDVAGAEAANRSFDARQKEYERQHAAWEKQNDAREACVQAVDARHEKDMSRQIAAGQAVQDRMAGEMTEAKEKRLEALSKRMEAAEKRGDQAAMRAIADTVMREMQGVMAAGQEATRISQQMNVRSDAAQAELKRCPTVGAEPQPPTSGPDLDQAGRLPELAAAKASGLTAAQYSLMRERIVAYVQLKGRTGNTSYAYTAAELEALGAKLDELQKRPALVETRSWRPDRKS